MPNNSPPPKNVQSLSLKMEEAKKKSIVDYALYGLLTAGNLAEISALAKAGVIGFKCFMGETVGNILPPSDGEMLDQFAVVSSENLRVSVHAENDPVLQSKIRKLKSEGRGDVHAHYESRPPVVEEEAVRRAILYAAESKCKLHIAHLSSDRGVTAVAEAKRKYQPVTAETCPQYLVLDDEHYSKVGSLMKVNPSVKTSNDRSSLWEAVNNGTVDMIASDHSPHALEEKKQPMIFDCVSGFPGLETSVPLMLTQVNKGMLALTKYVKSLLRTPPKRGDSIPKRSR